MIQWNQSHNVVSDNHMLLVKYTITSSYTIRHLNTITSGYIFFNPQVVSTASTYNSNIGG